MQPAQQRAGHWRAVKVAPAVYDVGPSGLEPTMIPIWAAFVYAAEWRPESQSWFTGMFNTSGACANPTGRCTTAGVPTSAAVYGYLNYSKTRLSCATKPLKFSELTPRAPSAFAVVDVTMVAYDLDALEIRLFELAPVVDLFIIVESTVTQRGDPKPMFYDAGRFHGLGDRIRYVVHTGRVATPRNLTRPFNGEKWQNEAAPFVRAGNELQTVAKTRFGGKPIVVHSGDVDEFFSRGTLSRVTPDTLRISGPLCAASHVQYLHNINGKPSVSTRRTRGSVATVRLFDGRRLSRHRCNAHISGVQFHLSMFMDPATQLSKEISVSEGGGVMIRYDSAPNRIRNPCSLFDLMASHVRPCCADRPAHAPRHVEDPLPLLLQKKVAWRFPHLFSQRADCICPAGTTP